MKAYKFALQSLATLLVAAGTAAAQTTVAPAVSGPAQAAPPGSNPAPVATATAPAATAPIVYAGGTVPAKYWPTNFNGPLAPVAAPLLNDGVRFDLTDTDQMLDNVSEGVQGKLGRFANTNKLVPGAWFDLYRLMGIPGAQIHFAETFHILKVAGGTGISGENQVVNSGEAIIIHQNSVEPNTLTWLSWDQHLMQDRLDLEVGRMNVQKIMFTPVCDNIMTCVDTLIGLDLSVPPPTYATWTGKVAYNFTPHIYTQVAEEEIDFHDSKTRGYHFGVNGATGYLTMGEVAYKDSYKDTPYPSYWEFGGWDEHNPTKDPYTGVLIEGTSGYALQGQKILWRQDGGTTNSDTNRRIGGFIRLFGSPNNSQVYQGQFEVGLNLYSPFESRPYDVFGIKFSDFLLGSDEYQYLRKEQFAAGGTGLEPNSEYFEINAHFQINRAIAFEPSVIYAQNPDNYDVPKTANTLSGFIVGAFITINFGQMLGLSATP
jgi:porin